MADQRCVAGGLCPAASEAGVALFNGAGFVSYAGHAMRSQTRCGVGRTGRRARRVIGCTAMRSLELTNLVFVVPASEPDSVWA